MRDAIVFTIFIWRDIVKQVKLYKYEIWFVYLMSSLAITMIWSAMTLDVKYFKYGFALPLAVFGLIHLLKVLKKIYRTLARYLIRKWKEVI